LEKRVEQAFRPGSVSNEVIEEIAGQVAANSGDCREALEILLRAGRKVDRKDEKRLNLEIFNSLTTGEDIC
jgi:cell division control protein 6